MYRISSTCRLAMRRPSNAPTGSTGPAPSRPPAACCAIPDSAEEVVQDVFAQLWRRPRAFDERRGSLHGYITMLARSRAIDRWRTQAVQESALERLDATRDPRQERGRAGDRARGRGAGGGDGRPPAGAAARGDPARRSPKGCRAPRSPRRSASRPARSRAACGSGSTSCAWRPTGRRDPRRRPAHARRGRADRRRRGRRCAPGRRATASRRPSAWRAGTAATTSSTSRSCARRCGCATPGCRCPWRSSARGASPSGHRRRSSPACAASGRSCRCTGCRSAA